MPPVRQQSLAGGELSPDLWARTEFDKYAAGARRLQNFIVTPWGSAANRPGTRYVAETRASGKGRMIPFTFSETDTLLLVFTDQRIRFYALDPATGLPGIVLATGAPAYNAGTTYTAGLYVTYGGATYRALRTTIGDQPDVSALDWVLSAEYEVVTPYTAAQLPKLRYAQVGDVITICHPSHAPRELIRTSAAPLTFDLQTVTFDVPAFPAGIDVYLRAPLPTADATYPAKQWIVKATAICEDAKGNVFETQPYTITEARAVAWNPALGYDPDSIVYHEGKNWVTNTGIAPLAGEEPGVAQRDLASPPDPPNLIPVWVQLSLPALPEQFPCYATKQITVHRTGAIAGDPGYRVLAYRLYRGRPKLYGYVGELSDGGVFVDSGDTPDWTRTPPKGENPFKVYGWNGALLRTENPAIVAYHEQRRVFARTDERPGFVFFSATNAFSLFDQHSPAVAEDSLITELASWRWEEVRALVSGRVLLALSSSTEWALDGGQEGVAITPLAWATRPRTERGTSWLEPLKTGDDEVLFVPPAGNLVRELAYDGNTGKYDAPDVTILSKHLFAGRQIVAWDWQEEPWSVVWVVLDDGKLLSLSYVRGEVAAWSWHDTSGVIEDVCCVREGSEDAVYLVIARTLGEDTKRYIERMNTRQVTDAKEGVFLDSALTYRGAPATHIDGLGHLAGKTVNALADGVVVRDLVVAGDGSVDLSAAQFPDGAELVHVGLPYTSQLETLDLGPGEGRTRVKAIKEVAIEFRGSRGGHVAGGTDEPGRQPRWEEWRQRKVSHGYGPIPMEDGVVSIPVNSEWNKGGRALVKQTDPLPLTILAVTREVEYGG